MNRKGNLDLIIFIFALLFIVLLMIFFSFIYSKVHAEFNKVPEFNNTKSINIMNKTESGYRSLDWTIFWAFIGICLFLIITSYLIRTNPIFVVVMLILLFAILMFSMLISNTYESITLANPDIYNLTINYYPRTNFIFLNLPYLVFVIEIFSLIALFAKPSGGNV